MIKQFITIEYLLTTTFLILLARVAYADIKKRKIPDRFILGIFFIAFLRLLFSDMPDILQKLSGVLLISAPMLLLTIPVPGAFGGGDIKLMAACGLYLGAPDIFYSFFYALVLGGAYSIYLIAYKNKSVKTEFALGPFLVLGIFLRLTFCNFLC